MRVIFLTSVDNPLKQEHYFTINVALGLHYLYSRHKNDEIIFVSLHLIPGISKEIEHQENEQIDTYHIYADSNLGHSELITEIAQQISQLKPDVIHSQLIDGYEIEAAQILGIPVFNTIHVGGIICPRSTVNGFLRPDDSICQLTVGNNCEDCLYKELPLPWMAKLLHPIVAHGALGSWLRKRKNPVFYLTPLSAIESNIEKRLRLINVFQNTNLIVANKKLIEILRRNGLTKNIHYLPHGVKNRKRLDFPAIEDGKIKFYMLNRVQYSKGTHVVLEALKGIPNDKYELHIIGGSDSSKLSILYWHKLRRMSKKLNVVFHGKMPNNQIDAIIKDCHVMIHATIFHEVYGISIAESLSIGRPIIATRCGGAEEQVQDGVNGWLIEPNDVSQMRAAILNVIDHPTMLPEYVQRCKLPHPLEEYILKLDGLYRASQS